MSSEVAQSCPTVCDPMDGSPPGSPVPGILPARTLEWVLKATLWMKAQHEGALTPLCIVQKNPQVPHTALQEACHPVNNSRCIL